MMSIRFKGDGLRRYAKRVHENADWIVERMAKDVENISKINVPLKSGDLHQSGEVERMGHGHYRVYYGKSSAGAYAGVQERGKRSGAKAFTNYTTPGTGAHFLENAANKVKQRRIQYIKQGLRKAS